MIISNEEEYECQKLPIFKIQEHLIQNPYDKVVVKLESYQIINQGGKDFVGYNLKTSPFNWVVQRRYSDFVQLKSCLET